ncbi:MAG: sigma-54-dependent transcriptional regulator [Gammaproteobacteria bacterium]
MADVLIVDDDRNFTSALAEYIQRRGFSVRSAKSIEAARAALSESLPNAVLIDLVLPDGSGLEIVDELEQTATNVILVTAHPSVPSAVAGLRARVMDYLVKPVDMERLRDCLDTLSSRIPDKSRRFDPEQDLGFAGFIGRCKAMRELYNMIEKVAPTEANVLLRGESGTGKEVAARAIHDLSNRSDGPFLALNCAAVPESLIGDELFGHERGGFTGASQRRKGYFERADGGTLFLDEITEMPIELQATLLRVLESKRFTRLGGESEVATNVRIIAATNRNLNQAIESGVLREDLYFRLSVFPIELPPLRERDDDIELLAKHFVQQINKETGLVKRLSESVTRYLYGQNWSGNVRELRNAIERAYILAENEISAEHFCIFEPSSGAMNGQNTSFPAGTSIDEAERRLILVTLDRLDGNKKLAAESLGISLKTLYNKLNRYQIK